MHNLYQTQTEYLNRSAELSRYQIDRISEIQDRIRKVREINQDRYKRLYEVSNERKR